MGEEAPGFQDPGVTHPILLKYDCSPRADRGRTDRIPDGLGGTPSYLIGSGLDRPSEGGSVLNPGFSIF